jgi:rhamnosyltransferase
MKQWNVEPCLSESLPKGKGLRVCAVVVSYNSDSFCGRCIRQIIDQADHTVIVDNGSGGECLERIRSLASERATVVLKPSNLGIAAALNIGIRQAHDLGFELFLLLDHDTELLPGAIGYLVSVREACRLALGRSPDIVGGAYVEHCDGVPCNPPDLSVASPDWIEELVVITSGSLIDWRTFADCGLFREDFFIDMVDHEYCLRLRLRGGLVVRTRIPVGRHRLGEMARVSSILSLGRLRTVTNHTATRRYYQVRNLVLLKRLYGGQFPDFMRAQRRELRSQLRHVLKYEHHRWSKLWAAWSGLVDGWRGIAGKRRA